MDLGGLMTLDLATNTGWAAWTPGQKVFHGVMRLPSGSRDLGKYMEDFHDSLIDLVQIHNPDKIAYELPYVDQNTAQMTARKLMALSGFVEWFCRKCKIECYEINNSTWRAHFLRGVPFPNGRTRDFLKAETMKRCRLYNWEPINDNDADALGQMDYFAHVTTGYQRHIDWIDWGGPGLFAPRKDVA